MSEEPTFRRNMRQKAGGCRTESDKNTTLVNQDKNEEADPELGAVFE